MSKTLAQSYYDFADFLGISLKIQNKKWVVGQGTLTLDFGLCRAEVSLKIISSVYIEATGECAVLVSGPQDLGVMATFEPKSGNVMVAVVDLSQLECSGVQLFEQKLVSLVEECLVLVGAKAKAWFEGPVRGPFGCIVLP